VVDPGRRKRTPSAITAAAAALIAASSVVVWATRPPPPAIPARQDADEELRRRVLRVAQEEKERVAEFEKKLTEAEQGRVEARALLDAGKASEAAARAEELLRSFPKVRLAVLDPAAMEHRAALARNVLREIALTAQIQLLKAKPAPEDAAGLEERAEVEIRLYNRLRETLRERESLKDEGPRPKKDPAVEVGGAEPSLQKETLDKVRSIKITISMQNAPLSTVVKYVREISGLGLVLMAPGDAPVTLELSDVSLEAAMEYLTRQANTKWEVDRFGIIVVSPAKK